MSEPARVKPWRYSVRGVSLALRVTPRGGRDDIDGLETLASGREVVKVRVRAIAEGGEANKAVIMLLSKSLRVPRSQIRLTAGVTSRVKQVEIDGDPRAIGDRLQEITARALRAAEQKDGAA